MKTKKMLAILAALSVLGTTGLTVGAEDTVTTTELATEASTTTETEAETTTAETEEITETTTEEVKAVEDSNREGKIYATKEYTMGSHVVKVVLYDDGTLDSSENPVECMSVYVDGNLTNLSGVVVNTAMNGDGSNTSIQDPDSFLTVTGTDAILVTPYSLYGGSVAYTYDAATNTFVPAGEAPTTTTTTAAETTTTTTTTTTAATDAIIDQKTETMIVQGKPYALRFVLLKSTDSDGYCVSIYVDGKLVISRQPVGYFEYSPTSVSSYAGVSRGSVSEVTVTDWDKGTTVGTTTSFHYRYDPDQGVFVAVERSDEDSETTSAKEALYNKFVAAYGKPAYTNYGDFDQDGEPDAYFVYYDSTGVNTYFVTKDSITLVDKDTGDSMWSSDFAYFTCNGYRFRANLHTRITVGYAGGYITIERIEADGSLTKVNFKETVMSDYNYEAINKPNFAADLSEDFADKIFIYFSSNGDKITVTHYLYDDGRDVGSNSYVYDAATNSFVESSEAPTTTATTEDETTTTTTTTTKRDDAHPIDGYYPDGDFQLDGVTLTPRVEINEDSIENPWVYLNIYSKDGTRLLFVPVDGYSADEDKPEGYGTIGRYLVKTGSNTITVIDYSGSTRKYHSYVFENGKFVLVGTSTDGKTDDGKTDNGSASNAPASTATKNTSGTPKTGDTTTVPAVAVGLTLTAAGVVAFISKRKK